MPQHPAIRTRRLILAALALAGACLLSPTLARADEHVDAANKAAAATSGTKPAEDVLFPALLAMDEPPLVIPSLDRAGRRDLMILTPKDTIQWEPLERWAQRDPQRAALEALHKIADVKTIFILGIPYDTEGVNPAWVEAGLCCNLGVGEYLINVRFEYFERLRWLATLSLFEAARLASEGKGAESLEAIFDLMVLGRVLSERAFAEEKVFAFVLLEAAAERLRDVVTTYTDAFESAKLSELAEKIHSGALNILRIPLPAGDRITAEQLLARAFEERGEARQDAVAEIMAGSRTSDRPLRLFAEAAWWRSLAENHADWFDTGDRIREIWRDYSKRWELPFTNEIHDTPSHFSRVDASSYPVLYYSLQNIEALFEIRFNLMVDLAGTYNGLGVYAFKLRQRKFPPSLAAITPGYVKEKINDITNLDRRYINPQAQEFRYKVPIRDDKFDRREDPHPYEIEVVLQAGAEAERIKSVLDIPEDIQFTQDLLLSWFMGVANVDDLSHAPFRPELVNLEERTIDVAGFKEAARTSLRQTSFTREKIANLQIGIIVINELAKEGFTGQFQSHLLERHEMLRQVRDDLGVDIGPFAKMTADALRALIASEGFAALAKKAGERPFEEDDVRKFYKLRIDTIITDYFMTEASKIAQQWGPRAVAARVQFGFNLASRHYASPKFTASLDDSVFMLWAVGEDAKDDRAKIVGPIGSGAADILFWPPIITLEREFNR